jgi:hypothetical protein
VADIRMNAKAYVDKIPHEVRSNGEPAGRFKELTGMVHADLIANWKAGGKLTSCNSFTGVYATSIGLPAGGKYHALSKQRIDLAVQGLGKGYAWVEAAANPTARPMCGDVFLMTNLYHVGVSYDVKGGIWYTAEGGQGGPSTGTPPEYKGAYDSVKRKQAAQNGSILQNTKGVLVKGWVDIDLYMNGLPVPVPMAQWLKGWWVVAWRGQLFYYYFEAPGKVSWTLKKPVSESLIPYKFDDVASVVQDSRDVVTVKWNTTGTVEKFKPFTEDCRTLIGDWNDKEPLFACRGLYYNPPSI